MRRIIGSAAGLLATAVLLTGCVPDSGPLVGNHSEGVACAVADGRPTFVATQAIDNRTASTMKVRAVRPAQSSNSKLRQTLAGPAMNGLLIVGGYDPNHGLNKLRDFEVYELKPKSTMMVVFVSDVLDRRRDAAVQGVHVEYTVDDHNYAGDIPWTYRFTAGKCN